MLVFFVSLYKLLRAIRHGIKYREEFRVLLIFILTLLAGETYLYWDHEGWSIVDSLYFSVMTMSTIGYGDFAPTAIFSKIFTIIFLLLSIGVFVAVVSKIVSMKQLVASLQVLKILVDGTFERVLPLIQIERNWRLST
jgi:hypothetical protein